jgi:putative transposase
MLIAHKIALDPNNRQATYFIRAAGCARFAYNWALAEWQRQYEAWKELPTLPKPTETALRRQFNAIKREQFPWMLEVTKNAPQMAIIQLGQAFRNFFEGRAQYPQFRKKGVHDRFSLTNDQFRLDGSRLRIPHLGWVRMRETLRFSGKILSATISREADRWFVSVTVDTPDPPAKPATENQDAVGVDLGVSLFSTLSTGEQVQGPKPHKALLGRLRWLSRSLSRKHRAAKVRAGLAPKQPIPEGVQLEVSENARKTRKKLARLHARIGDIRRDALHRLTTDLTRRFAVIGIEDLNIKGMMKNRRLARSIADMSFSEFRRQLEYKAAMRGGVVVVVDRWFASSKTCSTCGHTLDHLPLSVREWICPACGACHDRDLNAALNLKNKAVSSTVSACGASSDGGTALRRSTSHGAMKQELSTKDT